MKKILVIAMAGIMMLTGCSAGSSSKKNSDDDTLFTVKKDGKEVQTVSVAEGWLNALLIKSDYEMYLGEEIWQTETGDEDEDGNAVTYAQSIKEEVLGQLKEAKLVSLKAQEEGITLTKDEKAQCESDAAEYYEQIPEETVKKTGITVDVLTQYSLDYAYYDKYYEKITENAKIEVTDEEAKQSKFSYLMFETSDYDEDKDDFVEYSDEKKAAQKKKAEKAYKMLQSGKSMSKVADELNIEVGEYTCAKGDFGDAFDQVAFALKEGEISKVTEFTDDTLDAGYYILKMDKEFDKDATSDAKDSIKETKEQEAFEKEYKTIEKEYEIDLNEKAWEKIDLAADLQLLDEEAADEEGLDEGTLYDEDAEEEAQDGFVEGEEEAE